MHTLGYATISCTIISHLFWPLLFTKKKKMNCMSNEQFERTSAYLIKSNVRFLWHGPCTQFILSWRQIELL